MGVWVGVWVGVWMDGWVGEQYVCRQTEWCFCFVLCQDGVGEEREAESGDFLARPVTGWGDRRTVLKCSTIASEKCQLAN